MARFISFMLIVSLSMTITGCAMTRPLTVLERRALESRDLECSYDNAYRATITVLQDEGFNITNSNYEGGIIKGATGQTAPAPMARSPLGPVGVILDFLTPGSKPEPSSGIYATHEITVTIEKYTDEITKMRLAIYRHWFDIDNKYTGSGRVEDGETHQKYYATIKKEIFMREQLEK